MKTSLRKWPQRSADYANLFNPAFLTLVLAAACEGFETGQPVSGDVDTRGIPYALLFVAAPLALSNAFNAARPRRGRLGTLVNWTKRNPRMAAHLSAAACSLAPVVREGIVFALQAGHLLAAPAGRFRRGELHGALHLDERADLAEHLANSHFAGRWLAKSGPTSAILESFGLRP